MASKSLAGQLISASINGLADEVRDLLEQGVDPDGNRYRPLHWTCINNHVHCADLLIKWGAGVNLTGGSAGTLTALHLACQHNSIDCVRLLLSHNCCTDTKNGKGKTAAELAREKGYNEVAELVSSHKSPPTDPLSSYPSHKMLSQLPVHQWVKLANHFGLSEDQIESIRSSPNPPASTLIAAKVKRIDLNWKHIVEGFLAVGEYELADRVCTEQGDGHSSLAISVLYCWMDLLKYLIDTKGLNPNDPVNKAGDTVLSIACLRGNIGVIDYLVKDKHCDPDVPMNAAGDSLRFLATSNGLSHVIKYLDGIGDDSSPG